MAWGSTAPAAIDGILAALRGWPDLQGVSVVDGPEVDTGSLEVITVGFEDENETAAASEGTLTPEGLAAAPDREQYTVAGEVAVLNGNAAQMPAARERAFELLSAVGGALAADQRLGGAVMRARLGAWTLRQTQGAKGAIASIVFGIDVEAYTAI